MKLFSTVLLSVMLIVSACAGDTATRSKTSTQKSSLTGLGKDSEYRVETPSAFSGINQVVIGGFKIGFLEQTKTTVTSAEGSGNATANVQLKAVDASVKQHIADAAYGDFIARLQKRGYKVIERTALIENRDYAKANKERSPLREEATFAGEEAVIRYVAPRGMEGIYFTGEAGRSGGFGFSNPQIAAINFAKENHTPVVFVTYYVDFAQSAKDTPSAEVQVTPRVAATAGSGVRVVGGQGGDYDSSNGSVSLAQSVSSDTVFGVVSDTTSRTSKGLESASNLFSSVLGGSTNKTRDFDVKADAKKYQVEVLKVLAKSNDKLTAKIEALR